MQVLVVIFQLLNVGWIFLPFLEVFYLFVLGFVVIFQLHIIFLKIVDALPKLLLHFMHQPFIKLDYFFSFGMTGDDFLYFLMVFFLGLDDFFISSGILDAPVPFLPEQ